jgi:hypothetical protein
MKNSDSNYIHECFRQIATKLKWGDHILWTNYNFEQLSSFIEEKTHVKVSGRTLRRLVKEFDLHNPQLATKNALARYLDYKDWQDFTYSIPDQVSSELPGQITEHETSEQLDYQSTKETNYVIAPTSKKRFEYYAIFALLLFSLLIIFKSTLVLVYQKMSVKLISNTTIGQAPLSVKLNYDISRIKSPTIFIDKNYFGESEIIAVKKSEHFTETTFKLPNYYSVKLIAGTEQLAHVGIHVLTKEWESIIDQKYLPGIECVNDGKLYVPFETAIGYGIKNNDNFYVEFRNSKEYGISMDGFELACCMRNTFNSNAFNNKECRLELIGENGNISFNFLAPGSQRGFLKATLAEKVLDGDFDNLDKFIIPVDQWFNFKIKNINKEVDLFVDDKNIFNLSYKRSLGQLKCIIFRFKGTGEVSMLKIKDTQNDKFTYVEFTK